MLTFWPTSAVFLPTIPFTNLGGGTGSVFSLLPPENATGNYVKVVQRVPVRIDFDRSPTQDFNAEGLLKPGLSVGPSVRVR